MAVYGGMLPFFSEQARRFPLYTMNPLPKGGYSKRIAVGYITAIFQYVKKGNLTRENDTEADVNVPVIWSRVKLDISKNLFIVNDDTLFRLKGGDNWYFEGGFYSYILEEFVGNSDSQVPHEDVNLGIYE